jgi:hypothetical protein
MSDKSGVVAGLLQLFFGCFGAGRFYLGSTAIGILQLCVGLFGSDHNPGSLVLCSYPHLSIAL